ncbi:MAG TPA: PQQ-dependent sugar dehydrogenase [Pyrinomonadaceae bacterium]|nr:PQQ-dependent sugar dehydrogenase [Pyrinomonadaceae bacterium]
MTALMVSKRRFKSETKSRPYSARAMFVSSLLVFFVSAAYEVSRAATLPSGFSETQIASGLSSPTAMDIAPDGRIFICLQGGNLRVVKNGVLLPAPFLHLSVDSSGERGLLGVAFDPNFATNNFIYVYYTVPAVASPPAAPHNRVSRFTANADVVATGSEVVLLNLNDLSSATNHNGGAIHFGPDGKLYIAVGENANPANSQTLANLLGKVLRVNSDGTIPSDNPFFNTPGARKEIWALGLRNPFTFSFQRGTTRMFINDVGQNTWEEINDGIAGSNYGWNTCEGFCSPSNPNFRDPLFEYGHGSTSTTGCAIVGGGFYNPPTVMFPASFVGKYFFADLCSGWMRLFDPANNTASDFASGISTPVDIKIANDGSLYYLAIGSAALFRVQFNGTAPNITTHPSNQTVLQGQPVTFTVAANGTAPFAYQWQRNQVNINGATSPNYTINPATFADDQAKFRCVVTNAFGNATSNEATLTVNAPPTISTHPSDQTVTQGQPVTFTVSATGSAPFTYQWQRNQANIGGATAASYTINATVASDNGAKFRCVVTNGFGNATSNEATLTVNAGPPALTTENGTDRAIALDSVTLMRDPFPLTDPFNLSSDNRTRVAIFATSLTLAPGEDATAITARGEDPRLMTYPLTVEYAGAVPGFGWLTEVIFVMPGNFPAGQDMLVSITWHSQTTNKVRIKTR